MTAPTPAIFVVGMNTPASADSIALEAFNDFYNQVHLGEVLRANPGFVRASRYELYDAGPFEGRGPRWLAVYEIDSLQAARAFVERNDGPVEGRPVYSQGPPAWRDAELMWRMVWRGVSSSGPAPSEPAGAAGAAAAPRSLFVVGMNPAHDADEAELEAFNQFYTDVHVPEVMKLLGYARGTRFELLRGFRHPEPGCPRFCAMYEAGEAATQREREERMPGGAAFSSGPRAWRERQTLWRLVYRRVGP